MHPKGEVGDVERTALTSVGEGPDLAERLERELGLDENVARFVACASDGWPSA